MFNNVHAFCRIFVIFILYYVRKFKSLHILCIVCSLYVYVCDSYIVDIHISDHNKEDHVSASKKVYMYRCEYMYAWVCINTLFTKLFHYCFVLFHQYAFSESIKWVWHAYHVVFLVCRPRFQNVLLLLLLHFYRKNPHNFNTNLLQNWCAGRVM